MNVKGMWNGFEFIFLDRIYRIDGIFFACGERPFGRCPIYPDNPVDRVQLLFKDKNPFLLNPYLKQHAIKNSLKAYELDRFFEHFGAKLPKCTEVLTNMDPGGLHGFNFRFGGAAAAADDSTGMPPFVAPAVPSSRK